MAVDRESALVLVIDDEEDIVELICYTLKNGGFDCEFALTGEDGVKKAQSLMPDLILLDIMLPELDGMETCKIIRSNPVTSKIPVIFLTAKSENRDVVNGLDIGGNDYITKPFSADILLARIRAQLRSVEDDEHLIFGDIVVRPSQRSCIVSGVEISLTSSEFAILLMLIRRPGIAFSRNKIIEAIYGEGHPVTDRAVDVQIAGLRKKLGAAGKSIETVWGVGYRFQENV